MSPISSEIPNGTEDVFSENLLEAILAARYGFCSRSAGQ